jgi:predicted translation initiation factor SUI1
MALQVPCPQCGKLTWPDCGCPPLPPGPPDPPDAAAAEAGPGSAVGSGGSRPKKRAEVIGLRRERRAGRDVIVIEGLPGDLDAREIATALKRRCASGGTVKGRAVEIQGDHREAIEAFFGERGFRTKRTGG